MSILSRAATAVLGLLGRALETVLAVVKGLCRGYTQPRLQDPANYRCSLGTNTVLGLVTNGLLALLPDDGPEN